MNNIKNAERSRHPLDAGVRYSFCGGNRMKTYTCFTFWFPYMKIDIEAETRGKAKADFMRITRDADFDCDYTEIIAIVKKTKQKET